MVKTHKNGMKAGWHEVDGVINVYYERAANHWNCFFDLPMSIIERIEDDRFVLERRID